LKETVIAWPVGGKAVVKTLSGVEDGVVKLDGISVVDG
jgi:hypothetical protein